MKKIKENKGITLLALIVTIIILIILAGISISALTGDNSIIKQAGNAKVESEISKEKELLELAAVKTMGKDKNGNIEKDKLQEELNKSVGNNKCDVYGAADKFRVLFKDSQRWYEIDGNGAVEERVLTGETDGIYIANSKKQQLSLDGAMVLSPVSSETPSTLENLNYMWTSSNPSVATVSIDGIVMCGTEKGTTTITCKGANSESTCEITTTAKIEYENNTNSNRTINGEAGTYQNPTIPDGYYALTTNDATWNKTGSQTDLNNGLCVMDKRGNQFVWIPVPDVVYDGETTIGGNYTPMAKLKDNSDSNYEGILYAWDGTTATQSTVTNNKEPISLMVDLTKNDETKGCSLIRKYIDAMKSKTDDEIVASWDGYLQEEYNKLINSVSRYGGFWISRYEVSFDLNQNKVATIAGVKVTKADDEITKTWYGLNQRIKSFAKGSNYKSTMLWGSGYDAILNWLLKNGIQVGLDVRINGINYNTTKIAGNPQYNDKLKNIYDLIGCTGEWTCASYARNGRCVRAYVRSNWKDRSFIRDGRLCTSKYECIFFAHNFIYGVK